MIRVATKDDLNGVLALYKELRPKDPELSHEFAKQKWQEIIEDKQTAIVIAEIDGVIASTCALSINKSIANGARPFAIIEHVITSLNFRRQGLSQKVLKLAIEIAWENNCYKVMLLSGATLEPAHKVYQSLGFNGDIERGFVLKPI